MIIASATSSGKTIAAELYILSEIARGGKAAYLAPLRALAQERIDDWTASGSPLCGKKISICTGDYRLTKERARELNEADLVILTTEMLSSRTRHHSAEQSEFLKDIGTLVADEFHGISAPDRGSHAEVGMMKFTQINPKARLVLLSATLPNVEEIGEWVSYSLTGRETFVLRSGYRPCPLNVHYEAYFDGTRKYDLVEKEKVEAALRIVRDHPDDKFLIFAHTKRTGEMMKEALLRCGIPAEFHNAALAKHERIDLENRFRGDQRLRTVVATSTLAAGLNMPARRVIVLGVHRGLSEVDPLDVIQMCGRAGRPKYDKVGDAYVLLPQSKLASHMEKIQTPPKVESQLLAVSGGQYKTLAFHLVSEIHRQEVRTTEDVQNWYKRSFGHFQARELDDRVVADTLESLRRCGAAVQEAGVWTATTVGQIASLFYFSPFDVADLKKNFTEMFQERKENDDHWLSFALGNTDSQRSGVVSRLEKDETALYAERLRAALGSRYYNDAAIKAGYCYYQLLKGDGAGPMVAFQRNLQFDYERLSQVLLALESMGGCKWNKSSYLSCLEQRVRYGCPAHLVDLCRVPGVGKMRAKKLYEAGYKDIQALADIELPEARKLLNLRSEGATEVIDEAKKLALLA